MSNTIQFNAQLDVFARNMDMALDKVIRKVALDVFTKTVVLTPVDSGALRASWVIGVNVVSADKVSVSGGKLGKGGASMIAKQQLAKLSTVKAGDSVNITNNQPYAGVVEYGLFLGNGPKITQDGYSTQAPAGMLRKSVQIVENSIINASSVWMRVRG